MAIVTAGALMVGGVAGYLWPRSNDGSSGVRGADMTVQNPRRAPEGTGHMLVPGAALQSPTLVGISRDPLTSQYDPVVLMALDEKSPLDMFEEEPRVPVFAVPREEFLTDKVAGMLKGRFDDVEVVTIECRASTCLVELSCPDNMSEELYQFVQRFLWASACSPSQRTDGERSVVYLSLAYTPEMRDHDRFTNWQQESTAGWPGPDDPFWETFSEDDDE